MLAGSKPGPSLGPQTSSLSQVSLRPCWLGRCGWGPPHGPGVAGTEPREPLQLGPSWGSLASSEAPAPVQLGTHALH